MKHFPFILIACLTATGLVAGYLGALFPTPVYEASTKIVVLRHQIENPFFSLEQPKNRWIWLRDGLAIEQILLSDSFLETLSDQHKQLKDWREDVISSDGHAARFYSDIRQIVKVEFTGADSFSFNISARESNADLALLLVESLVIRLKLLVTNDIVTQYQTLIRQMNTRLAALKADNANSEASILTETIENFRLSQALFDAEATRQVQVVERPFKPIEPVFPNRRTFTILGGFAGLALSFALLFFKEYFRVRENHAQIT